MTGAPGPADTITSLPADAPALPQRSMGPYRSAPRRWPGAPR